MLDGVMAAHMVAVIERDGHHDEVAVEEPMEIRVDGQALSVTMRTPGHDEELALGFLLGEGLIDGPRAAGPTEDLANNIVAVAGPLTRDPSARRFYTTSSCGVCGRGSLEEVAVNAPGRHNAMDKVVGRALLDGLVPLHPRVLCVSGRLSFEVVQKAAVAGAPILVGVGAPTSLAIELAEDRGLTLAGFTRGATVNVHTRPERAG
jgi:FdhD protein